MNTGMCGFATLIYFHMDSYRFLKNGAPWSTDNITISPDTSRKKIMDVKTINLDSSKRLVVFLFIKRTNKRKLEIDKSHGI